MKANLLSIEIMKNHFTFLIGTLGGSRKNIHIFLHRINFHHLISLSSKFL